MKDKILICATENTHIEQFQMSDIEFFRSNGYEIHIADNVDSKRSYCDIKHTINFSRSPLNKGNIEAYRQLSKLIKEQQYRVIHCHNPIAGAITRIAARKYRKKGLKVIYTAHGFHFYKGAPILNWTIYYPVEKICSYFTDGLITINKEDYQLAQKKMRTKNIYHIPGIGVDVKRYGQVKENKSLKKEHIGIPEDATMLLSVGEINKNKNHEVIIRAISNMNSPNIYYCIAGVGELKEYLIKLARELKVLDKVIFLGFRKDINELCHIADIFCFPSYREGLSVALMEAMAAGLPVICSDIRGNQDLIKETFGGYLCNPKEADEFAKRIRCLVENRELIGKMSNYNMNKIIEFDILNVRNKMEKIYKEILN